MKASSLKSPRSLKLTLMMGAAATLTSCSEAPQSFTSVADCVQYGKPEGLCRFAYEKALSEHAEFAPTFGSNEECLKSVDVDQCFPVQVGQADGSAGLVFMPVIGGFMLSKALSERREEENQSRGYSYNGGYYHGSPIYRSRKHADGYWTSAELKSSNSSSAKTPNVKTTTVSRSGFGVRSSFGGG